MKIFITDKNKFMDLELVPENTNNTWDTNDEIEEWNNGRHEDAGFHWNDDEGYWETDYSNYKWWSEVGEGRQKAYNMFYAIYENDKDASEEYMNFEQWFRNETSDVEDDKRMYKYVDDYLEEIED